MQEAGLSIEPLLPSKLKGELLPKVLGKSPVQKSVGKPTATRLPQSLAAGSLPESSPEPPAHTKTPLGWDDGRGTCF